VEPQFVTREKLYEEVWAEAMTTVAKRYDVSSNYLAQICDRLRVPHPLRGYWAQLDVGKAPPRPPLPEALPGDEVEWARDGKPRRVLPKAPDLAAPPVVRPAAERPKQHPLVAEAKPPFEGALVLRSGLLRPTKRSLIDIVTSGGTLPRALKLANGLFLTLEDFGYRVVLAPRDQQFRRVPVSERDWYEYQKPWWPDRPTVVFVGSVAYGLTIYEVRETNSAGRISLGGKLCIRVYSPYNVASWQREWMDPKAADLAAELSGIAKVLAAEAPALVKLVEEGEQRAAKERREIEAQLRDMERKERERKLAERRRESKDSLLETIDSWAEAKRIEEFFKDAENRMAELPESERTQLLDRLKRARALLGGVDALERFRSWKSPDER
jgi:hypothetical protein